MKKTVSILILILIPVLLFAEDENSLIFDTADRGDPGGRAPIIKPWKQLTVDPVYGGDWIVAGDVDGDGRVDFVSARNVNKDDVHYTSAATAQRLDGSVIWHWGDPRIGRRELHHDVACQVYDWNGDGKNEVILSTKGYLVELDGATGKERRRIKIPDDATDCIVFANLSGNKHASDVLVKTRYTQIWAYDYEGKLLWTVEKPGGYRTSHQPRPIDIDGDGRDEIMAGYTMLNPDGSERWTLRSEKVDLNRGHLDCCRVLKKGKTPEEYRLVLTYCGANDIALADGNGKVLWEITGYHFESVNIGKIYPHLPGLQILVDIDHQPHGEAPLWVIDETGKHLGRIVTNYCRHHKLIDWTGDGYSEIAVAHEARGLFDRNGRRIATFGMETPASKILLGDMTGDGIPDIALTTLTNIYIYKNTNAKKTEKSAPLGTETNFTYY